MIAAHGAAVRGIRPLARRALRLVAVTGVAAAPLAAQSARCAAGAGTLGTIVVAHGAGAGWNEQVLAAAQGVRTGGPVEVSFLMGAGAAAHRFQDVVARLAAAGVREIAVVPLLVSSHSGHYEQVRYLAGGTDSLAPYLRQHLEHEGLERPAVPSVPLRLTSALDDAPELADVLADRALALAADPAHQALLLVGHGPNSAEDYAAWMSRLRLVAGSVRERTGFRDVKVSLLRDDAPAPVREEAVALLRDLIGLQAQATGREVVVVPILLSDGAINREKIPADLAGLPIRYDGRPLLPHPAVAAWMGRRACEATPTDARPAG